MKKININISENDAQLLLKLINSAVKYEGVPIAKTAAYFYELIIHELQTPEFAKEKITV